MPVVRFNGKKLDPATIRALVSGTLVNGSKPSVWWNRQSIDFRDNFMDTMRQSARNGESLTQAITRVVGGTVDGVQVPGIMPTTRAKAGALVATAQNAVANEAALATFQENNDVIKAVTQLSTLDNRTSDICVAYSGQTWDVNTLQPIMGSSLPFNGGPPRHFNCRSRLRPVTMSFRELGIDADEIPAGTRASMDGQVPSDITFNQFLRGKSKSFQDDLLGPKRANLWRNDDITLTQLVDMRGNPMTIAQLEDLVGIPKKPTFNPGTNRTSTTPPPKPKTVNSFLENDDGSFVQITQAQYDEIRNGAKRLVAAADDADELVTSQIKSLADDVKAKFPDAPIVKDGPDVVEGSLHWRKKDLESTSRKIQTYARDRNLTFTEATDQISDSLRYTYIVDEADYIKAVQETMERFAEMGYKNGKFDAAWFKRPDYRGLNINMVTPEGVKMELQFHTAKSFEIKNGINHELYEKFRKLSTAKQKGQEGQLLQAQMKANADTIPFPPRIEFLDDLAKIYNKPSPDAQRAILFRGEQRAKAAARRELKAAQKAARDEKAARLRAERAAKREAARLQKQHDKALKELQERQRKLQAEHDAAVKARAAERKAKKEAADKAAKEKAELEASDIGTRDAARDRLSKNPDDVMRVDVATGDDIISVHEEIFRFMRVNGFTREQVNDLLPLDLMEKFNSTVAKSSLNIIKEKAELLKQAQRRVNEAARQIPDVPVFKSSREAEEWTREFLMRDKEFNTVWNTMKERGARKTKRWDSKQGYVTTVHDDIVAWGKYDREFYRVIAEVTAQMSQRFNMKLPNFLGIKGRHPVHRYKAGGGELAAVEMETDSLLLPGKITNKKVSLKRANHQEFANEQRAKGAGLQQQHEMLQSAKAMKASGMKYADELVEAIEDSLERKDFPFTSTSFRGAAFDALSDKEKIAMYIWDTMIHESGHRLHGQFKKRVDDVLAQLFGKNFNPRAGINRGNRNVIRADTFEEQEFRYLWSRQVSEYATDNPHEFLAESFTRYMMGDHKRVYPPLRELFDELDTGSSFGFGDISKVLKDFGL